MEVRRVEFKFYLLQLFWTGTQGPGGASGFLSKLKAPLI